MISSKCYSFRVFGPILTFFGSNMGFLGMPDATAQVSGLSDTFQKLSGLSDTFQTLSGLSDTFQTLSRQNWLYSIFFIGFGSSLGLIWGIGGCRTQLRWFRGSRTTSRHQIGHQTDHQLGTTKGTTNFDIPNGQPTRNRQIDYLIAIQMVHQMAHQIDHQMDHQLGTTKGNNAFGTPNGPLT